MSRLYSVSARRLGNRPPGALRAAALLAALFLGGCATIMHGETQKIKVDSAPKGAVVVVDGVQRGTTPGEVFVARDKSTILTFKREDADPVNFQLVQDLSFVYWANLFFPFGFLVDYWTGASYVQNPSEVFVTLDVTDDEGASKSLRKKKKKKIAGQGKLQGTILVVEISSQGVPATTAEALTTKLIAELMKKLDNEIISVRVAGQGPGAARGPFPQCADDACVAEAAEAMGADVAIQGSLFKVNERYTLSVSAIDTSTGKTISRASSEVSGKPEELSDTIPIVVQDLMR